jgi:hypothetical protein
MNSRNPRIVPQTSQRRLTENAIRLHQIDAEIMRLTRQLEYMQRVRQQYAHLIDTEQKNDLQLPTLIEKS